MVQVGVIFTHFHYQTTPPLFSFSLQNFTLLNPIFHSGFYKSTFFLQIITFSYLSYPYDVCYTIQLLLFHYPSQFTMIL